MSYHYVVAGAAEHLKCPVIWTLSVKKGIVSERILQMAVTLQHFFKMAVAPAESVTAGTGIVFWQGKLATSINLFLYIVP